MNAFLFMSAIALFLASIIAAGCIVAVASASIVHFFPNSKAAEFLRDLIFDDAPEIQRQEFTVKAGDCISTSRLNK